MHNSVFMDQAKVDAYRTEGVVLIKGLFADWVEVIRSGIERNMTSPGPTRRKI